jgi:hypothetical protein
MITLGAGNSYSGVVLNNDSGVTQTGNQIAGP